MIIFENEGEVDPRALTIFGVNVKENESPIGFFGTGFKYATSILLRNGQEILVQNGQETHTFRVQNTKIRGKVFELICMDEKELGFTTEVGKNWEMWMAYRELYCNCVDENGRCYYSVESPKPEAGKVRVIVKGGQFESVHRNRSDYIITSEPLYRESCVNLHKGPSNSVFYKGICVGVGEQSYFKIEVTTHVSLTEDRTLKYPHHVKEYFCSSMARSSNEQAIFHALTSPLSFERNLRWIVRKEDLKETFRRVLGKIYKARPDVLNQYALSLAKNTFLPGQERDMLQLTEVQYTMLRKSASFLERRFKINLDQYKIIPVKTLGIGVLGRASDGKILLTEECFSFGTKTVAATLLEEYVHLKYGYDDYSRAIQEKFLNLAIGLAEELDGTPL